MRKKFIVSLCGVSLLSLGTATITPAIHANADDTTATATSSNNTSSNSSPNVVSTPTTDSTNTTTTVPAQGQTINVGVNESPEAYQGIANRASLPTGTTYSWNVAPNTGSAGEKDAKINVVYPNGTTSVVSIKVNVISNDSFHDSINLIDKDGKVIGHTSILTGKIGDHVTIPLPKGYVSANSNATSIDYVLNREKTPITIKKVDVNTAKRTIKIIAPDGTSTIVEQHAKNGKFAKYVVPVIKGYAASQKEVPSTTEAAGNNKTFTITYKATLPKWTVGLKGYKVIEAGSITRTVNFVDEKGKKIATSKSETVNREILAKKDTQTPSSTLNSKNKTLNTTYKDYLIVEVDPKTNKTTVVGTEKKLADIQAPTIKGYTLKDSKLQTIKGQYFWLSTSKALKSNPKLDNGLSKYILSDSTINVEYTSKGSSQAATTNGSSSAPTVNSENNPTAGSSTSTDNQASTTSGPLLPQTGSKPSNLLIVSILSALGALGLGVAGSIKERKQK